MARTKSGAQPRTDTIAIRVPWLVTIILAAVAATAGAAATSALYQSQLRANDVLTKERDTLKSANTTLQDQLRKTVDPEVLSQCQSGLVTLRANKNEAVHNALLELDIQQQNDVSTMRSLLNKKWESPSNQLSGADQVLYNTAAQHWTKYPEDRSVLLKQLVCVP